MVSGLLKPFPSNPICEKCGSNRLEPTYCDQPRSWDECAHLVEDQTITEHLHVRCKNCGYMIFTEPIDPADLERIRAKRTQSRRKKKTDQKDADTGQISLI